MVCGEAIDTGTASAAGRGHEWALLQPGGDVVAADEGNGTVLAGWLAEGQNVHRFETRRGVRAPNSIVHYFSSVK
jgi:hypothetical protein